jgi:hypothetical protein
MAICVHSHGVTKVTLLKECVNERGYELFLYIISISSVSYTSYAPPTKVDRVRPFPLASEG